MTRLSYSRLYQQQRATESIEQVEEPIEIGPRDFAQEYRKIKAERDSYAREIQQLREAIRQVKDDYAAEHDRLVQEQQAITDEKCQETEELQATLRQLRAEIDGINDDGESWEKLGTQLPELAAQWETVAKQEAQFAAELNRYTRALLELGSSTATTGNELLLGSRKVPSYRGSGQSEAAALAQSLYSLRMVLIRRYAESINSGCNPQ
jgi:uncharacterized coiled-coil DUF342 family protein